MRSFNTKFITKGALYTSKNKILLSILIVFEVGLIDEMGIYYFHKIKTIPRNH